MTVPPQLKHDKFGLPNHSTILTQHFEKMQATQIAKELFASIEHLLGEENARRIFKDVSRRPAHRPMKAGLSESDRILLETYDRLAVPTPLSRRRGLVAQAARTAKNEHRDLATPASLEKRLSELLKARRVEKRESRHSRMRRDKLLKQHPPVPSILFGDGKPE